MEYSSEGPGRSLFSTLWLVEYTKVVPRKSSLDVHYYNYTLCENYFETPLLGEYGQSRYLKDLMFFCKSSCFNLLVIWKFYFLVSGRTQKGPDRGTS